MSISINCYKRYVHFEDINACASCTRKVREGLFLTCQSQQAWSQSWSAPLMTPLRGEPAETPGLHQQQPSRESLSNLARLSDTISQNYLILSAPGLEWTQALKC